MGTEETLRMKPGEGNLLREVPRLEGPSNVALWQSRLFAALDKLDKTSWTILQATHVPYDGIIKPVPARAEIRQRLCMSPGTLESVIQERIDTYINDNYLKPNAAVQVWLAKDKKVRELLMSTLEDHVKDRVANTKHAFEAFNILKNLYRAILPNIISIWTKWTSYVFEEDTYVRDFVTEWNKNLDELFNTYGQDAVSVRAQVGQFIAAATRRQLKGTRAWVRHLRVDLDAPDALARVQADFTMEQGRQSDPDYFRSL